MTARLRLRRQSIYLAANRLNYNKIWLAPALAIWRRTFDKPAFHDADTDTDILARTLARMSACRSACHRNNFRKSRVSDVRIGVSESVSVSALVSWKAGYRKFLAYMD